MWENIKLEKLKTYKFCFKRSEARSFFLTYGFIGLKARNTTFIKQKEVKSVIFFIKKNLKKTGKVFFNFMPNHLLTKKPIETRMGKGKGNKDQYAAFIPRGRVFLSMKISNSKVGVHTLDQIKKKLSVQTKIIDFKI